MVEFKPEPVLLSDPVDFVKDRLKGDLFRIRLWRVWPIILELIRSAHFTSPVLMCLAMLSLSRHSDRLDVVD